MTVCNFIFFQSEGIQLFLYLSHFSLQSLFFFFGGKQFFLDLLFVFFYFKYLCLYVLCLFLQTFKALTCFRLLLLCLNDI